MWQASHNILFHFCLNHIYLCSLSMSLIINIYLHHMLYQPLLLKYSIHISWSLNFFTLNFFLTNSELITKSVALLSKSAFTVILSYVSKPIFTVISLHNSFSPAFYTSTSFFFLLLLFFFKFFFKSPHLVLLHSSFCQYFKFIWG